MVGGTSVSPTQRQSPIGDCTICGHLAHGVHFGALACRACAAFFRRTVVLGRKYKCRRSYEECEISKEERFLCRCCRFKKCLRLGMTRENVQWHRHRISSDVGRQNKHVSSEDMETVSNGDSNSPATSNECASSSSRNIGFPFSDSIPIGTNTAHKNGNCEVQKSSVLSEKIQNIFTLFKPEVDYPMHLTALQRMTIALRHLRSNQNRNPQFFSLLEFNDSFGTVWEEKVLAIAEWMQHCEEFVSLEISEKRRIFRYSWWSFQRLERASQSIQMFGEEAITEKKMVISDNFAINRHTKVSAKGISDYGDDYVVGMMKPHFLRLIYNVCKPMCELRLTEYETVYMLCQVVWNLEGRPVSECTMRTADSYRERISNDLHDYYVHTLKLPNYAARLAKIMGILRALENLQRERAQAFELARFFDIFKFEFREADILDYQND